MSEEYQGPLISADGHVVEPADLWTSRMPAKWRDKAPRIENVGEMGDCMIIDGLKPRPIAFEGPMIEMKARGEEIPKISDFRYDDCRAGSWNPDEQHDAFQPHFYRALCLTNCPLYGAAGGQNGNTF